MKRKNVEEIIEIFKNVHKDKYDYSSVEYNDMHTKVCIICPEHGEFWITPNNHKYGKGCPKCSHQSYPYTKDEWIEKVKQKHNNKYIYDKVIYKNIKTKVNIICPEHGEFYQTPHNHLQGQGCPKCAIDKKSVSLRLTKEHFIAKSINIHSFKYDYSKVNYINYDTKVCIICPEHGEFWQTPDNHLQGCGCPKCCSSKMENNVRNLLESKNIPFEEQKKFEWLGRQTLDFYLPDHNVAIECQGIQHFEPIEHFGGQEALTETIIRDKRKKELCNSNNIKMVYFIHPIFEKNIENDIYFTNKEDLLNYLLSKH